MGRVKTTFKKGDPRASAAGKKSKRPPFDKALKEYFDKFFNEKAKQGDKRTRQEMMIEAAWIAFMKGNYRPLAYLLDRSHGKAAQKLILEGGDEPLKIVYAEKQDEKL